MDFMIESFVGAGPIKFGMTKQEVQKLSLGSVRSFSRTSDDPLPSDHFTDLGVIVSYQMPGLVEAIEFSRPSAPVFSGARLFDMPVDQFQSLLADKDPHLEVRDDGFIAHGLGIGAYVLGADEEENEPAELVSVIVFRKNYYEE